jgi:hypothetical protein
MLNKMGKPQVSLYFIMAPSIPDTCFVCTTQNENTQTGFQITRDKACEVT